MHSRKSIFYKGIVFVASFLAMLFLTSVRAQAACSVTFVENSELTDSYDEQYVILSGDLSGWQDRRLQVSGGCTNLEIEKLSVNGKDLEGTKYFVPSSYDPGHYTIGYHYKYDDNGTSTSGVMYRYLRILNENYSLDNNYTLGVFDLSGETSVIESFYMGDNYFVNFVENKVLSTVGTETVEVITSYVVVKNALGETVLSPVEIKYGSVSNFRIVRVLNNENKYYVIGNIVDNAGTTKGVVYSYTITDSAITEYAAARWMSETSVYNGGYLYINADGDLEIYTVGSSLEKPVIEKNGQIIYTDDSTGEYKGITVIKDNNTNEARIYAVGYASSASVTTTKGLYTYIVGENKKSLTILDSAADTKFNDIIFDGTYNIVVGETNQGQIYASNGSVVARNENPAYHNALILQVSLDGTTILEADLLGTIEYDTFSRIKKYKDNEYSVVGSADNGAMGLAYNLQVAGTSYSVIEPTNITSNSDYFINGRVYWENGYVYYGALKTNTILGVYYPDEIKNGTDGLFIALDNRSLSNFDDKEFKQNTEHKYATYAVGYGSENYYSEDYKKNNEGVYDTSVVDQTIVSVYAIPTQTGGLIYVYRTMTIVETLTPLNLSKTPKDAITGVLNWHIYNRSYTYINTSATRYEAQDFNYIINADASISINDMIDSYFETGNTKAYNLRYSSITTNPKYVKTSQTQATFASIEYARKYAYYQEFSRVVRMEKYIPSESPYPYSKVPTSGSAYYVYYIDTKGANVTDNDTVQGCQVSATAVTNCTNKAGYSFVDLNSVKEVIENLLKYKNYFVSSRNTIYNGSIPTSDVAYVEDLTTTGYVSSLSFANQNTEMEFNVLKNGFASPVKSYGKNIYFGGTKTESDTSIVYKNSTIQVEKKTFTDTDGVSEIEYYESNNGIYFLENACYSVYYSSGAKNGSAQEFCLDNTAPAIVYRKTGYASSTVQYATSSAGTLKTNPLYVETDFKIEGLIDLDEYAYIYINGSRYPMTCSNNSETCMQNINKYLKQSFRYDEANPMGVRSITVGDRLMNTNTFYFVIGTKTPTIEVIQHYDDPENVDKPSKSFTLKINFYQKNPITSFTGDIFQQICGSEDDFCYKPEDFLGTQNPVSDADTQEDFFNAIRNYIYAVSYRDRDNIEALITIAADEFGVYTISTNIGLEIKSIRYIIEDGYFVEYDGYQEELIIDEENKFEYNGETYAYNALSSSIQQMKLVDEEYVIDEDKESLPIIDGVFKFEEDGKEYKVVETEEGLVVNVLPLKYEIYTDPDSEVSTFKLNDVEYTIDYTNSIISYDNPALDTVKTIQIEFVRTTSVNGKLVGGVDIPTTLPICDAKVENCTSDEAIKDTLTGLPAYGLVEGGSTHYDLVDGVYIFSINQSFNPREISKEAYINILPLKINLGIHNHQNAEDRLAYEVSKEGKAVRLSFDIGEDEEDENLKTLSLDKLQDGYKYPLNDSHVKDSNFAAYSNTYFTSQTVYAALQLDALGQAVFVIKVYDHTNKNQYGLPDAFNESKCQGIVVYGSAHRDLEVGETLKPSGCTGGSDIVAYFDSVGIWEEYGVAGVASNDGTFAFFGQNKFYNISLLNFGVGDNNNGYSTINYSFYIDSLKPLDEKEVGNDDSTIESGVYEISSGSQPADIDFSNTDGKYVLNNPGQVGHTDTIGSNMNVYFKFNWYQQGPIEDTRENKMLILDINGVVCNLYQLLQELTQGTIGYNTDCLDYVDKEATKNRSTQDELQLVFSKTDEYQVTFRDASRNEVVYSFKIDKSAPEISLSSASMETNKGNQTLYYAYDDKNEQYTIQSYVKAPIFKIRADDISGAKTIHYAFITDEQLAAHEIAYRKTYLSEISKSVNTVSVDAGDNQYSEADIDITHFYIDHDNDPLTPDISFHEYLLSIFADTNVTLYVWGVDDLGNGNIDTAITIRFWADYQAPTMHYTAINLNEDRSINMADPLSENTISIRGDDYSTRNEIQCLGVFNFEDTRESVNYTFSIDGCNDAHNSIDRYPSTPGAEFINNVYIKFYLGDEFGNKVPVDFPFIPKVDSDGKPLTEWIYIVLVDMVGNESEGIHLPIFVLDSIAPSISGGYKCSGELDCQELLPVDYDVLSQGVRGVYLANSDIKIEFSERISKVSTCYVYTQAIQGEPCVESEFTAEYEYADNKTYLYFNSQYILDDYKIVVFKVEDFGGNSSESIVVVIDKKSPEIDFEANKEIDVSLEYMLDPNSYGNDYKNGGYTDDVYTTDDQKATVTVNISYEKYLPKETYRNYVYDKAEGVYKSIEDGKPRNVGTKYYLLLNKDYITNKACLAEKEISGTKYCYVEDIASRYYFEEMKDADNEKMWSKVSKIDNSSIGVYRIVYSVTDYAGNVNKINQYKIVYVNDTINPDIDVFSKNSGDLLYSKVISSTQFNGKLNQVVTFKGVDDQGQNQLMNQQTKIIMYMCEKQKYELGTCDIDQPLYSNADIVKGSSTSHIFNMGDNYSEGIYKVFVYDNGNYTYDNLIYHEDAGISSVIALTHNAEAFYFAYSKTSSANASYTIYGNNYTSDHQDSKYYYEYSDSNYYLASGVGDVYFMKCSDLADDSTCLPADGTQAVGFGGTFDVVASGDNYIARYYDTKGRVVYEVTYGAYNRASGAGGELLKLYLHETYYHIQGNEITLCRITLGVNNCEAHTVVHQIDKVNAYIYDEVESLKYYFTVADSYGNISSAKHRLVVDNQAYVGNKEFVAATGVNYWFSVPKRVITQADAVYFAKLVENGLGTEGMQFNVLSDGYVNNFNSDFFYAFASRKEALEYLQHIYAEMFLANLDVGVVVYNPKGEIHASYNSGSEGAVANLNELFDQLIIPTFIGENDFGDSRIKQKAYDNAKISMYQYVYLIETKTVGNNGRIERSYTLSTTCGELTSNQTCIKVDLKIVDSDPAVNKLTNIKENAGVNDYTCITMNAGGGSCNLSSAFPNGAIYVFIDADISEAYHTNFVYYGVTSYSEKADIKYNSIGSLVPVGEDFVARYKKVDDGYQLDDSGDYIWINSKWESLKEIMTTNLYEGVCNFNGEDYTGGCVYVTYASSYKRITGGTFIPDNTGSYYYNYYTGQYVTKAELIEQLSVEFTTSNGKEILVTTTTEKNIPWKIDTTTRCINSNSTGCYTEITTNTNKKTYIELFRYMPGSTVSKFFEVTVADDAIYSYATLLIDGIPQNINKYIKPLDGGGYVCILDIDLEKSYTIVIKDRAGNQTVLYVSHSSVAITTDHSLETDTTNSSAIIHIETTSKNALLTEANIVVQKHDGNDFVTIAKNATCYGFVTTQAGTFKATDIKFNYSETVECQGVYRIITTDTHGNSKYIDFVFNPYVKDVEFVIPEGSNIHTHEKEVIVDDSPVVEYGVIVNNGFSFSVNSKLYKVLIRKYKVYTNFNPELAYEGVVDFSKSTFKLENSCPMSIVTNGNISTLTLDPTADEYSCDGIYQVEIINKFSQEIAGSKFEGLFGANTEEISYIVQYENATKIEIDTTAPDVGDSQNPFFTLYVDDEESEEDTITLLNDDHKTIAYTNKFITISWGTNNLHSFAYLKYRIKDEDTKEDEEVYWQYEKTNVTYNYVGEYTPPSKLFKITEAGVYECEFMFADAVGNENANQTFTIVITIEAPDVGFFVDAISDEKYENGARIADKTILKCGRKDESSGVVEYGACTMDDYNYNMQVNGLEYSGFYNDEELSDYISRDSYWMYNTPAQNAEELMIVLTISVKGNGKEDIKTQLKILIDKKAPFIQVSGGDVVGTTLTGNVTVSLTTTTGGPPSDITDNAKIYACDNINQDGACMIYQNKQLVEGRGRLVGEISKDNGYSITLNTNNSGYFIVYATDGLGNTSEKWFVVDNEAPTIQVTTIEGKVVAHNMYTNSKVIYVSVSDKISSAGATYNIQFTPLVEGVELDPSKETNGFTKEGKYVITPKDGVGIEGRAITFYIYKQAPSYNIATDKEEDAHVVNKEATLSWEVSDNELIAPIISVTLDGSQYKATYNSVDKKYVGSKVTDIGEHTFVVTDAAGNTSLRMITINNTNKVCINGITVDVKMQAFYTVDKLLIGGEEGIQYEKDDVVIFALPSQSGSESGCGEEGLLSYRTLDPENSNYLISTDANARTFNNTKTGIDFISYNFISKEAINEVNNVGGTVVVFVVTKDVANDQLGYSVGTNFFVEDPVGWIMIFAFACCWTMPVYRIFVKKKVRVI